MKDAVMVTLHEICHRDRGYLTVIRESSIVKNAVTLLGGRRREGKSGGGGEEEGGGEDLMKSELSVGAKARLLWLLVGLVKRRVEMPHEEELMEVALRLEEMGNKHVQEEGEEEEEEGTRGGKDDEEWKSVEKREWEELSEKAGELIWRMEGVKNRREGKKRETLKMMKKREEEMEKRINEAERGREEEKIMKEEEKKRGLEEKRVLEERIERMEKEMERMKKEGGISAPPHPYNLPSPPTLITSLDETSVVFSQKDGMRIEGNTITNAFSSYSWRNCFIGGVMTSV